MPNIAKEGDRIVSARANEVINVVSPETRKVIDQLLATMAETGAMGFAAPQIHIPLRIFIFSSYPHVNHENAPYIDPTVVINPVVHTRENPEKTWEKCYSLPGIRGFVPRSQRIIVSYNGQDGSLTENRIIEGFPAQLFEHEYDHLDGLLYKSRVKPEEQRTDIISDEEYRRRFVGDKLPQ